MSSPDLSTRDFNGVQSTGILERVEPDANGLFMYFAYGSNMSEKQLTERVGAPAAIFGGCLHGYRLVFNKASEADDTAFANVEPAANELSMGKVYLLTQEQLASMDSFEGAPIHYSRLALEVRVFDQDRDAACLEASIDMSTLSHRGTMRNCVVYVANPEFRSKSPLRPRRRYLRKLLIGGPLVPKWYTLWLAKHDSVDV